MWRIGPYLLIAIVPLVVGCGSSGSSEGANDPPEIQYGTPANATDGLLLEARRPDGSIVEYFGRRSDDGTFAALSAVAVRDSEGADPTVVGYDDALRPVSVLAPNGTLLRIDWREGTNAAITATAPGGDVSHTLDVDLTRPGESAAIPLLERDVAAASTVDRERCASSTSAFSTTGDVRDGEARRQGAAVAPAPADGGTLTVSLHKCGQPSTGQARVGVELGLVGSAVSRTYYASSSGTGEYRVELPTFASDDVGIDVGGACKTIVNGISGSCTVLSAMTPAQVAVLCGRIAAGIDLALGGPTGEGLAVFAGCEAGLTAARVICDTVNASPAPGAPSPADAICEAIERYEDRPELVRLRVVVDDHGAVGESRVTRSEAVTVSALGPYPDQRIELVCDWFPGTYDVTHVITSDSSGMWSVGQRDSDIYTVSASEDGTSVSLQARDGFTASGRVSGATVTFESGRVSKTLTWSDRGTFHGSANVTGNDGSWAFSISGTAQGSVLP